MNESTKALNKILHKYSVSAEEIIELIALSLERKVFGDSKEPVKEYREEEFERLFNLHNDISKLDWKFNYPY
ncbi:hypothetical protein [Bacillus pretiosus]|uniref:hypothetical protein n=1 Tax=Bacillus pretiosus TaxID=2983392 RepID=UPI003D658757